jgi:hypothetical protein
MALGTSLFLIALGAVLRFAVHVSARGFSIHTVGVILIVVGCVGLLVSLLWMALWSPRRRAVPVDDRVYPPRAAP